jgi:hypothetical protein
MRIDSAGNVGIGTAAPGNRLTVVQPTTYPNAGIQITGSVVDLNLQMNNTGASGKDWRIIATGSNSSPMFSPGAFRIYDNSGTGDRLDISPSGISMDARGSFLFFDTGVQRASIGSNGLSVENFILVKQLNSGGPTPTCFSGAISGYFILGICSPSSIRYKQDVLDLSLGLDFVEKLRPVSFTYKADKRKSVGLIAEDVEKLDTRLVDYKDGVVDGVRYLEFTPILIKAIQDQQKEIDSLRSRIQFLEQRLP